MGYIIRKTQEQKQLEESNFAELFNEDQEFVLENLTPEHFHHFSVDAI